MFWSRSDAKRARDVPPYRRVMPYLMRGANESAVYFDLPIDVTLTRAFIADFNVRRPETRITLFHVVLWAAVQTLERRPRLNRFVAGHRLWERDGIWISYSAKKRLDDDSPIVILKRRFDPAEDFEATIDSLYAGLREGRSDKRSRIDKELGALLALPGPGLRAMMALSKLLNSLGMLPKSFIDGDPMFASLFIANLASLKMDAGYHHLYEYGNIPIFCVIGQIKDVPVVHEGRLVARPIANLRFSYDERVEDGLYAQRSLEMLRGMVEDPLAHGLSTAIPTGMPRSEVSA
jgi:hypothetical protein